MAATYANGKPANLGDRVMDINSGEVMIIERLDDCPTVNALAHPVISDGINCDTRSLLLLSDARNIIHEGIRALTATKPL
jgi:hypothetical protein